MWYPIGTKIQIICHGRHHRHVDIHLTGRMERVNRRRPLQAILLMLRSVVVACIYYPFCLFSGVHMRKTNISSSSPTNETCHQAHNPHAKHLPYISWFVIIPFHIVLARWVKRWEFGCMRDRFGWPLPKTWIQVQYHHFRRVRVMRTRVFYPISANGCLPAEQSLRHLCCLVGKAPMNGTCDEKET
jgi:hypothetical protein